jgi:hypothetical protein
MVRPTGGDASLQSAGMRASESAFRTGMLVSALLVALGGALSLVGIENRRRRSEEPEEECHPCAAASFTGPGKVAPQTR